MNNNLLCEFLIDKENNTMTIKRAYAAKPEQVWAAYTQSELLDQWFAPKPLQNETKHMDFKSGGHWLYAMKSPDGEEYWGRMDYEKIEPIKCYSGMDYFCDTNGHINRELPGASWKTTFDEIDNQTLVQTVVVYATSDALETVISMGMKEGLTATMNELDRLLSAWQN